VDGANLLELNTHAWRGRIGFVTQEFFLLHASVAENIAFARPATRAEIEEAARLAGADAFVRGLPEGYDTVIGEQGLKLSGGQRQLIGIARAILTRPEILIFDEATNSLDARSEALVRAAIRRVSAGRMAIIVAHRLSTIKDADRIVVLDKGRVVAEGTHTSLLNTRGLYHALYDR
jgi:ATP-binding cassette subfamily B protein